MLRKLTLKRQDIRDKMQALWKQREAGEWTAGQRKDYESLQADIEKVNNDIKLRGEFIEDLQASQPKADREHRDRDREAGSEFQLIKFLLYRDTGDNRFKPHGATAEVIQERERCLTHSYKEPGGVPLGLAERTTIKATTTGSGKDLVEQSIYPSIIENLFSKSWSGKIGVTFIDNWRGDFKLPEENTKPTQTGWVAEDADYPEAAINFKTGLSLSPKRCGVIQPYSLQSFFQDETRQLQASVSRQMQKQWAQKTDDDMLNHAGSATVPKGILNFTGVQSLEPTGANGGAITYKKCIEAEGLLKDKDQDAVPKWLVNSKTLTAARSEVRFTSAGSETIATPKRFADRMFCETNIVKSNLTKGTGTGLSQAILLIPSSVHVVSWQTPMISLDRSQGFKKDQILVKVSGYLDSGIVRPTSDIVNFKSITTTS